jgi:hypothetical protein
MADTNVPADWLRTLGDDAEWRDPNLPPPLRRIEDARILYEAGRREGSLLLLLIAVAALSRVRYPRSEVRSDKEAFRKLLQDGRWSLCREGPTFIRVGDAEKPIEDFLYEYLRNGLIHEGTIPEILKPPSAEALLSISYGEHGVHFTDLLLSRLAWVVQRAREHCWPRD